MLPIENEIHGLEHFDTRGARVLSLYVRTDPARDSGRNVHAQIASLLKPLRADVAADKYAAATLERDIKAALEAIAGITPPARAVAAFACTPRGLAFAVPFRFPAVPQAHWDTHLHLGPLLAELDEHERALVVVLDKERLRLFRTFMGTVEELADFTDEVPGKHRQGGYAQQKFEVVHGWSVRMGYASATIQRHHLWHVRQHMDHVLKVLQDAQQHAPVDQILVSAPPEASAEFLRLLPRRWRSLVENALHVPMYAPSAEILEVAQGVQRNVERRNEERLVHQFFEMDSAHMAAGSAAVAEAVSNGEVLTFVYAADTLLSGSECASCGWLMPGIMPTACTRCGAGTSSVTDMIDLFITRVLHQGGRVEEVRDAAAERLARAEGVGALLRFSSSVVS